MSITLQFTIDELQAIMAKWSQHEIKLPALSRGCHLITQQNADPDVRVDMETFLSKVVPEGASAPWIHTDEGDDDMPGHVKCSMLGASLNIPITKGKLNLGTWQGIYLCEHRDHASGRRLVVTLQGQ